MPDVRVSANVSAVEPMKARRKQKNDMKQETQTPKTGDTFTHPTVGNVKVIAVHPLGTIDVENIWTGKCYRITGLPMVKGGAK